MGSKDSEMGRNQIMKGLEFQTQERGPFLGYTDTHNLSSINDPLLCVFPCFVRLYFITSHSILTVSSLPRVMECDKN